jgi:hypothetical protein
MDPMELKFWNHVNRAGPSDCWTWTGPHAALGYGGFSGGDRLGKYAHRAAWLLANGPIPPGLCVFHSCPNRRCVNPGHLFLAPRQPTLKERVARRRAAGERNPGAKIDEAQVRAIRAQLRRGRRQCDIAADFGVSQPLVSSIATGRLWRTVA